MISSPLTRHLRLSIASILFCEFPGGRILLLFPNRYGPFKAARYIGKSYANLRKR
jgi:hypothetical protein